MSKPYIDVEFNGQNKPLRFDINAIADIEEYFGKGISKIFSEDQVGFSTVRAFYWAGLKWKDRGLTIERAGTLVQTKIKDGETIETLMVPVLKAMQLSGLLGNQEIVDAEFLELEEGEEEKN